MNKPESLRIAIVNAVHASRQALRQTIETQTGWHVIWEAADGAQAKTCHAQDKPDLILMDLHLPGKSGVQITREIMASDPCAILMVATGVNSSTALVFDALAAGALDAVDIASGADQSALIAKIKTVSKLLGRGKGTTAAPPSVAPFCPVLTPLAPSGLPALIVIGASTGGPAALRALLAQLPADFPLAVVIAQHLDAEFASGMADWLAVVCKLPVQVARRGDRPIAGRVLLACTNDHLVLREDGSLDYTAEPRENPYRPSVDELFASAALCWRGPIVGVLLTGMGQDGARGLLALRRLGHYTIAQDEKSSVVYGMPGTAARFDAAIVQMDPQEIGSALARMIPSKSTTARARGG